MAGEGRARFGCVSAQLCSQQENSTLQLNAFKRDADFGIFHKCLVGKATLSQPDEEDLFSTSWSSGRCP